MVFFVSTNSENLALENAVKLFPNPTQGFLNVELTRRVDELHLYNTLGVLLQTQKDLQVGSHQIDFSNISVGTYFVKIHLGGAVLVRKILVAKKE